MLAGGAAWCCMYWCCMYTARQHACIRQQCMVQACTQPVTAVLSAALATCRHQHTMLTFPSPPPSLSPAGPSTGKCLLAYYLAGLATTLPDDGPAQEVLNTLVLTRGALAALVALLAEATARLPATLGIDGDAMSGGLALPACQGSPTSVTIGTARLMLSRSGCITSIGGEDSASLQQNEPWLLGCLASLALLSAECRDADVARILASKTDLLALLLHLATTAPPVRQPCLRSMLRTHSIATMGTERPPDADRVLSQLSVLLLHQLTAVLADPAAGGEDIFSSPSFATCICNALSKGSSSGSASSRATAMEVLQLLLVWSKLASFRAALARQDSGVTLELFEQLAGYLPSSAAADGEAADQRMAAESCMSAGTDLVCNSHTLALVAGSSGSYCQALARAFMHTMATNTSNPMMRSLSSKSLSLRGPQSSTVLLPAEARRRLQLLTAALAALLAASRAACAEADSVDGLIDQLRACAEALVLTIARGTSSGMLTLLSSSDPGSPAAAAFRAQWLSSISGSSWGMSTALPTLQNIKKVHSVQSLASVVETKKMPSVPSLTDLMRLRGSSLRVKTTVTAAAAAASASAAAEPDELIPGTPSDGSGSGSSAMLAAAAATSPAAHSHTSSGSSGDFLAAAVAITHTIPEALEEEMGNDAGTVSGRITLGSGPSATTLTGIPIGGTLAAASVAASERSLPPIRAPSVASLAHHTETEDQALVVLTCLAVLGNIIQSLGKLSGHWAAQAAAAGADFECIGVYDDPDVGHTRSKSLPSPLDLATVVAGHEERSGELQQEQHPSAQQQGTARSSTGGRVAGRGARNSVPGTRPTTLPKSTSSRSSTGGRSTGPTPRVTRVTGGSPGTSSSGAAPSSSAAPDADASTVWRAVAQRVKQVAKVCVVVLKQETGVVLPQHKLEAIQVGDPGCADAGWVQLEGGANVGWCQYGVLHVVRCAQMPSACPHLQCCSVMTPHRNSCCPILTSCQDCLNAYLTAPWLLASPTAHHPAPPAGPGQPSGHPPQPHRLPAQPGPRHAGHGSQHSAGRGLGLPDSRHRPGAGAVCTCLAHSAAQGPVGRLSGRLCHWLHQ